MGRREEAERLAAGQDKFPGRQMQVYSGLGDKERTLEALGRHVEANWWHATYLMQRPEMAFVRTGRRVTELRARLGLPPLQ
jgi:hypothetical protein